MKKILLTALLTIGFSAIAKEAPKNIIMIVGDGMGPAYTSAYRYFLASKNNATVAPTIFDKHLKGLSSTYPAAVSGYITDSAAGATALSTGHKTYNGAIAVDVDKKPLETVLEYAKKTGKKVGAVVTSQVVHATPAGYLAHNESRQNYNEIADSYLEDGFVADIVLGGGWKYFIREDRNLVDEFKKQGGFYLDSYQQLNNIPKDKPVLGLFANVGLPWALDDTNPLRLSAMTKAATKHLENKKGYFLLVEASQIDWGGHANDIAAAMAEMEDLAATLDYLDAYVAKNPDTLVVLTADHSTGGFTIAANGVYRWEPKAITNLSASPKQAAKVLSSEKITAKAIKSLFNFMPTDEEVAALIKAKKAAVIAKSKSDDKKVTVDGALYKALKHIIDVRTNTGWTSGGHTGIDVPLFAFGQGSEQFIGLVNNIDIANKIFTMLGRK